MHQVKHLRSLRDFGGELVAVGQVGVRERAMDRRQALEAKLKVSGSCQEPNGKIVQSAANTTLSAQHQTGRPVCLQAHSHRNLH